MVSAELIAGGLELRVPPGACDCHTHVFGPASLYPFDPQRVYTPGDASVGELVALQQRLGLDHVVLVQPSPYGSDNACMVDALRELGHRARGVAVIDSKTTDAQLHALHEAGVRGIRLNLETKGLADPVWAEKQLRWAHARVAPLGWHLQMFTNLAVLASLRHAISQLSIRLVLDHFCHAPAALGTGQPHFDVLLELVRAGKVWVKLSAPHRISHVPDCSDVGVIARALIAANPGRMLWGSDWPHTGPQSGIPRRVELVEKFNSIDDGKALNQLVGWAGDDLTFAKILVHNPSDLYDFPSQ